MNNSGNTNKEQQLCIWTQIISDCQSAKASGTKVKDWLKANNISKDTYYYWYREVKDSYMESSLPEIVPVSDTLIPASTPAHMSYSNANNTSFTPAPALSKHSSSIKLSVNGIDIEVNELTNPELLANVIKAVRYA